MPLFSIIVPVYNRPDEIADLLASLEAQTARNFELIVVEDGSTIPCDRQIKESAARGLDVKYFAKENEGRSIARNYGMEHASGDYFVFFDSDCVIPPGYFAALECLLKTNPLDCFGGPDAAHESFSTTQKAINFAMTSFLTTGGIRGGKIQMEKFVPRTFNMGFSRQVYQRVGGFREMFSEDIDMSTRIRKAGFNIGLLREVPVWHKRRGNLRKFFRQVYVFGMSRITLHLLYPGSLKPVHTLPAVFVAGCAALLILAVFQSPWWLMPFGIWIAAVFVSSWIKNRSLAVALKSVPASCIQLWGYGLGFIKAFTLKILMRRGRDINEEIRIRKGK